MRLHVYPNVKRDIPLAHGAHLANRDKLEWLKKGKNIDKRIVIE